MGAATLWLVQRIWETSIEYDSTPNRSNLKNQMMRRKTDALEEILEAMVQGKLSRVEAAAGRMQDYGHMIDGYLATDAYRKHGGEFHRSLSELREASGQRDSNAAKEATLQLERSCIECHILMNQPASHEPASAEGEG